MRFSTVLIAAMLIVAALPASAQIGWGASRNGNELTINITAAVPVQIQQITGAPYSGQENKPECPDADGWHAPDAPVG